MSIYNSGVVFSGSGDGYIKYEVKNNIVYINIKLKLEELFRGKYYLAIIDRNLLVSKLDLGSVGNIDFKIEHKNIFDLSTALKFAVIALDRNYYEMCVVGGFNGSTSLELLIEDYFKNTQIFKGINIDFEEISKSENYYDNSFSDDEVYDSSEVNINDKVKIKLNECLENIEKHKNKISTEKIADAIVDVAKTVDLPVYQRNNHREMMHKKLSSIEDIFDKVAKKDGSFYLGVKPQLDALFKKYPRESVLEKMIEGSSWIMIRYGDKLEYYTVGLIYENNTPIYICYGIPSSASNETPLELVGYSEFVLTNKTRNRGYFMMYQNADTGELIKINNRETI